MGVHSEDSLEQAKTCINWSLLPFWLLPLPFQLRIQLMLLLPRLSSMLLLLMLKRLLLPRLLSKLLLMMLLLVVLPSSKLPPQCTKSLLPLLLLPQLLLLVFLMESVPSPLLEDILMLDFLMPVLVLVFLMLVSMLPVSQLVMLVSHMVSPLLDSQWLPPPRLNKQTSSLPKNQIHSEYFVSNDQNFPLIVRVK